MMLVCKIEGLLYFYYSMTLKQKIYKYYLQAMQDKIGELQKVLTDLKESGANETKSTAGDKHETALAMLQIEQANVRGQLKEAQQQQATLQKINPSIVPAIIVPGSLIKTNKGYLFLSIAAGKVVIEGHTVMALSPQSPLGQQLVNATKGGTVAINNTIYKIESIE
jgi:transcription elongation GreA/GreB family factor